MPNRASGKKNELFSETAGTKVLMPPNHNGGRSVERDEDSGDCSCLHVETAVTLIGGEGGRAMRRGRAECREKDGERMVGTRVPLDG